MDSRKKALLEQEGYKYHFSRMVYFNRQKRKMFSREFIDDHPNSQIRERIRASKPNNEWEFYFNRELSAEAKQELLAEFGQ